MRALATKRASGHRWRTAPGSMPVPDRKSLVPLLIHSPDRSGASGAPRVTSWRQDTPIDETKPFGMGEIPHRENRACLIGRTVRSVQNGTMQRSSGDAPVASRTMTFNCTADDGTCGSEATPRESVPPPCGFAPPLDPAPTSLFQRRNRDVTAVRIRAGPH